jgi:transcriptional regulator with XRE-family HTH domain
MTANDELADLLRSRRAALQPADVGLPDGERRRTQGLRREEVAALANISTTYYTFLEQGRDVQPSRQVIDALARALRLNPTEHAHLRALGDAEPWSTDMTADLTTGPSEADGAEAVSAELDALVRRLDPYPTIVTGRRWDVLAANRGARALYTDWPALPAGARNKVWWTFTDPTAREVYVDWEQEAFDLLARFRVTSARHHGDPGFTELIERLHEASPEVRAWWKRHAVHPLGDGAKRFRHPGFGEFTLVHVVLRAADAPDQKLTTFSPDRAGGIDMEALAATVDVVGPPVPDG